MSVNVANLCKGRIRTGDLKKVVRAVLKNEGKSPGGVNVIICDDSKILELNRRFRQISKPTDVLSFPFNDSDLLGEVYISLDTAHRQAQEQKATLDAELKRLVVHGAVHLLGYDHQRKRDRDRMLEVESRYL